MPTPAVEDDSPVVLQSDDGWVITKNEIENMMTFIEETHQLAFTAPVDVNVSADIGLELASGFEIFAESDWYLLRGLGLADTQAGRDEANQVRRDRIRGVCCQFDGITSVAVEIQPTKLGTEMIVVHELTHALHTQHNELFRNTSFDTTEAPAPFAAAIEGVPQFVTFEYLSRAPEALQKEVVSDLPIIRDDMLNLIDIGPARYLNFAYATGPAFVDSVVEARGLEGLSDLMRNPPVTTEQVLFPQKYLAGEEAVSVEAPDLPGAAIERARGTIGAAMLLFVLTDTEGEAAARQLVRPWSGDQYVVYELENEFCLTANLSMDSSGSQVIVANALVEAMEPNVDRVDSLITPETITLTACSTTG